MAKLRSADPKIMTKKGMYDLMTAVMLVNEYFPTTQKAALWFVTPNPNLGGTKPIALFLVGRGHKVLKFIRSAQEGKGLPWRS